MAVLESKSITGASQRLRTSQPSITGSIQRLERELGTTLFYRSSSGVTPTPDGLRFADHAKKIISEINETASEFRRHHEARGHLVIAASTTVSDFILPPIIGKFSQRYPDVSVTLLVKNTNDVIQLIRQRRSDIGFIEGMPRVMGLVIEKFLDDELELIATPSLAKQIRTLPDLLNQPFLIREPGSGMRSIIEQALKQHSIHIKDFKKVIEMGSTNAIKQAAATGAGVGFASQRALAAELQLQRLAIITLPNIRITRTLSWCLPSDGRREVEQLFYRFANDHWTQ